MSHIFERLFWVSPDVEMLSEKANQFVLHESHFHIQPGGLINAVMESDFTGLSAEFALKEGLISWMHVRLHL